MKQTVYVKAILVSMYAIVSLFALMFINLIISAANEDMYYNEFYSQYMRKFSINYGKGETLPYNELGSDYALYFNVSETSDRDYDSIRAVYFNGNAAVPNMLEGRFFTKDEMENGAAVAVLGTLCKRNITTENGKDYYIYGNKKYEVVGYMGREDEVTDLDNMVWLNMGAYFERAAAYGRFAVDGGSEGNTDNVVEALFSRLSDEALEQAAEIIHERKIRSIAYFTRRIYNYVILALIINIAIVSIYYIDRKTYTVAVKKFVGASFGRISAEIISEYVSFASIGVAVGIIIAFLLRFTPFAESDEVFLMSFSLPSLLAMFAITVACAVVISVLPIIRIYRKDLSGNIK
ncbi:MAG: ABC transporter permease [Clostridia bacterium]|nr:ABC transporter permease [Clostridia bacterium]